MTTNTQILMSSIAVGIMIAFSFGIAILCGGKDDSKKEEK